MAFETTSELVGKRYSKPRIIIVIKAAILEGDLSTRESLFKGELKTLVKVFPEIELQAELLEFPKYIKEHGVIPLIKKIKDKYGELSEEGLIMQKEGKIVHMSISQLVSKLILMRKDDDFLKLFEEKNCLYALWEKVNTSILSKVDLKAEQNDFLSVSCLDVINGHYDYLKSAMHDKNDPCTGLADHPKDFRELSSHYSNDQAK